MLLGFSLVGIGIMLAIGSSHIANIEAEAQEAGCPWEEGE